MKPSAKRHLRGPSRRGLAIALAVLLATATAARAQDPGEIVTDAQQQVTDLQGQLNDPGQTCTEQTEPVTQPTGNEGLVCDSHTTPATRDAEEIGWAQAAGEIYPGERPTDYYEFYKEHGSPVPATVDFYTVSFFSTDIGLAGGAQCESEPDPGLLEKKSDPDQERQRQAELTKFLKECRRVPVIYRYWRPPGDFPRWERVYRSNQQGYVGGIAWLEQDEGPPSALAVGGTGCYPRREDPWQCPGQSGPPPGSPDPIAGMGRVWFSRESPDNWRERDRPSGEVDGERIEMTGMNALDASSRNIDCGPETTGECAAAGGLRQLWIWSDGDFVSEPTTPDNVGVSTSSDPRTATPEWRYRVRAIRFSVPGSQYKAAQALTSGCCDAGVSSDGSPPERDPRQEQAVQLELAGGAWRVFWPPFVSPPRTIEVGTFADTRDKQLPPDSLYAFVPLSVVEGTRNRISYLASPGGPYQPGEPGPFISGGCSGQLNGNWDNRGECGAVHASSPILTDARLVAGDGDFLGDWPNVIQRGVKQFVLPTQPFETGPDDVMDWAVGGIRSTEQAAAYTTTLDNPLPDPPDPYKCPEFTGSPDGDANLALQCAPNEAAAEETRSGAWFRLSSYFLNAFTYPAELNGVAWAVGDRGAIMRLAGDGTGGATDTLPKEQAPSLGSRRIEPPPDRTPYEPAAPTLAAEPGTVPAREALPRERLPEPRLVPYGAPNPSGGMDPTVGAFPVEDISQIAISRDGREGWAVGSDAGGHAFLAANGNMAMVHFDGVRWRRCGTRTVQGSVKADPACKSLRPLADLNGGRAVPIPAIARIPLEYDSDPTNDDEFEAIAVTKDGTILRYREHRWSIEDDESKDLRLENRIVGIAFSGPDQGWIVTYSGHDSNAVANGLGLYRFDGTQPPGEQWVPCGTGNTFAGFPKVDCEPDGDLLPYAEAFPGEVRLAQTGDRIYLYGTRTIASGAATLDSSIRRSTNYPFIVYKDPGEPWKAAFNPKADPEQSTDRRYQGHLYSLSVARGPDGSYNGWGVGAFGAFGAAGVKALDSKGETALIRADPDDGESFSFAMTTGAARDYLRFPTPVERYADLKSSEVVALPGPRGAGPVFVAPEVPGDNQKVPMVWFDPDGERWRAFSTPYVQQGGNLSPTSRGNTIALSPDGTGGFWAVATAYSHPGQWFYRYTDQAPPDVFEEAPHPVREPIVAAVGGGDASFWVATDRNALYRYDRLTGWDRMTIPGWDRGRIVTAPSPATAIAVGADGRGVVVGKSGRIAEIGPGGAVLDPAAGILCSARGNQAPCGSGYTLRAAAVAPDGSAMVGGDNRSLLWRSATGEFHAINPPKTAIYATITGISLPSASSAYLVTDTGEVWDGNLEGEDWTWELANDDAFGKLNTRDENRTVRPLRAVAVDAAGHGYAVGTRGTILERTGDGEQPWRWIETDYLDNLFSVTLGPGGEGALIGGEVGLVLTETGPGAFAPARHAERWDTTAMGTFAASFNGVASRIVGLALLPGYRNGQLEAWAASQVQTFIQYRVPPPGVMFHYSSDPEEPLLDGGVGRSEALADVTAAPPAELSFAAFGKSDCQLAGSRDGEPCPEMTGSNLAGEVIADRVRDEVMAASGESGGPQFALFTGDVGDQATERQPQRLTHPLTEGYVLNRWVERIVGPLAESGVPVFGAVGGRDLGSEVFACPVIASRSIAPPFTCVGPDFPTDTHAYNTGPNLTWRKSMAGMPAPWGSGEPAASRSGLQFKPVATAGPAPEPGDVTVTDPNGSGAEVTVPTGGAHTHYAFDIVRDGKPLLRIAVLDTSLRSLSASDAQQNPVERQLEWLREVLASRPDGTRAAVLTNTPTYSYFPGPEALTETAADGTLLEGVLREQGVDVVIAGRLGLNALYWALAPGLHYPCPGGTYPADPSGPPAVPSCDSAGSTPADTAASDVQKLIADQGAGSPTPFVVASSAGGKFSRDAEESGRTDAANGFWRGYTVLHLDPESGALRVDQRPILDWLSISGPTHVLRPRRKVELHSEGREPLGLETGAHYNRIASAAITHRYELLVADSDKPWLPKEDEGSGDNESEYRSPASAKLGEEDPCGPYLCLSANVGTIDDQSGQVKAGNGNYARTFAIAQLSVGDQEAVYPLVFEPRASYTPPRPSLPSPSLPPPPSAPKQPPIPNSPTVEPPQPPPIPNIEQPLSIHPVIPPTPPTYGNANPIDLGLAPVAIVAPPPTVVLQPPNPVVQPAPPSGARREARQRQAATQKSGASGDEGAGEGSEGLSDVADAPPSASGSQQSTRHEHSFTALDRDRRPSWLMPLEVTGGLGGTALILALAWGIARPGRRRPSADGAPAWNVTRRR